MNTFIMLVILAMPSRPGFGDIEQVIHREWITSSGQLACQQHSNKRAEEQREKRAADVARLKARVYGICTQPKETT